MRPVYWVICGAGVAGAILAGVFALPALTEPAGDDVPATAKFRAAVAREGAHCEGLNAGLDCLCFGQKSAHVMSHEVNRVQGFWYGDQRDLARGQAKRRCS